MSFFSDNTARRSRRQRGFGLLETVICISLMSLLFLGAMTLIISATRQTVRTQSQVYATADAANSIQHIIGQLREASAFALPTTDAGTAETTWNPMGGTSLTQFSTTLNGETINTAIQVITPPTLPLQVLSTKGGATWPVASFNAQASGGISSSSVFLIYRGDPDGTPDPDPTGNADPKAGTYLWQYTLPSPGGAFNPAVYPPTAICKSVSTAPNAVQFVRPFYANAGGKPEQNQVEIKIISSYYSPINGRQTSEEGSGASSSQLSGKCVFMRDHYTGSVDTRSSTRTTNNVFQYQ